MPAGGDLTLLGGYRWTGVLSPSRSKVATISSGLRVLAVLDLPEDPAEDAPGDVLDWDDDAGQRRMQQPGADAAVKAHDREITAGTQV